MRRRFGTVIAMVLCFILTVVSVYADDGKGQNPDYVTDYYMIVQSTQGGVDIYDEADTQSVKLNDSKIPNGTAIHVLGEKNGADNKKWAYTQYHGMNGYVPMDDLELCGTYTTSSRCIPIRMIWIRLPEKKLPMRNIVLSEAKMWISK